jgi:hypothetical protein
LRLIAVIGRAGGELLRAGPVGRRGKPDRGHSKYTTIITYLRQYRMHPGRSSSPPLRRSAKH